MEADKTQKLLKEKLKEKGLKVTHQRLLVLSVLEENSGSHMTAEASEREVKGKGAEGDSPETACSVRT